MNRKEKLKARKKAFRIWGRSDGTATTERIAKETGLTIEEVKYYKEYDYWEDRLKKLKRDKKLDKLVDKEKEKIYYKPDTEEEIDELHKILNESGLNERQKLFILYYLQSFNSTWACIQVGYSKTSAHVRGNELLNDDKVSSTINKITALMHKQVYVKATDIVNEYVKIAFADITEFVNFNKKKVELKSSDQVDGRLIVEVKQGRDGTTIKLADKMKALERLEKIFEILPDKRLILDREKFEWTKKMASKGEKDGNTKVTIVNDIR